MGQTPLLSMEGITKTFAGVSALSAVDFTLEAGQVHALVGENGAGKSTLIKIMTGAYRRDSGSMSLGGVEVDFRSPQEAQASGVAAVYQEVNLLEYRTVAENILLGREPVRWGIVDWRRMNAMARGVLARLGVEIEPTAPLGSLNLALRQMVAIARGVSLEARVIILDEPTSSLTGREVSLLLRVIRRLKAEGAAVVYISHRFDELYAACDHVTVLRDGRSVAARPLAGLRRLDLVRLMLGKNFDGTQRGAAEAGRPHREDARPILRGTGLARGSELAGVDLEINGGEIVGMAGLLGSGRTETARVLFGLDTLDAGQILLDEKPFLPRSPRDAIEAGMAFVAEDRKGEGIIPGLSVRENMTLAALPMLTRLGIVSRGRQRALVGHFMARMRIKASPDQDIRDLSGGNQQKVLLARWLCRNPKLLLLDEPTRGIDLGAKVEIREIIGEMAANGLGVLMISSELEELTEGCARVVVLRDGRSVAELEGPDKNEAEIMRAMAGTVAVDPRPPVAPVGIPDEGQASAPEVPTDPAPGVPATRSPAPTVSRTARLRTHGAALTLAVLVLFDLGFTPHYATADNLWNLLLQVSTLWLVAIGMTLVIATGGIDLSVGSIMAVASSIAVVSMPLGAYAAILGLLAGGGLGAFNGLLVARWRVPAFIATLALLIAGRGLAQVISNVGELVPFDNPTFASLGRGYLGPVPIQVVIALTVFAVVSAATRATCVGRYFVAVGNNEAAARLVGVPVLRTKLMAYTLSGLLAGLAGLIETARLGSTDPSNLGSGMEFNAIAAAAIGGAAYAGGSIPLEGSAVGALILVVIGGTFNMHLIPYAWGLTLQAAIILAAVSAQRPDRS